MDFRSMPREEVQDLVDTYGDKITIEDDMSKSTGKTEDAKQRAGAGKFRGKKTVQTDCDYERSANMSDEWAANPPGFLTRLSDGKEVGRPSLVIESQNFDDEGNPVMEDGAEIWTAKFHPGVTTSDFKSVTYPDMLTADDLTKEKVTEGTYSVRFHDEVEDLMQKSLDGWTSWRDSVEAGDSEFTASGQFIPSENARRFLVKEYGRLSNLEAEYLRFKRAEKSLETMIHERDGRLTGKYSIPTGRRTQIFGSPEAKKLQEDRIREVEREREARLDNLDSEITAAEQRIVRMKKDLGIIHHLESEMWPLLKEQVEALESYLTGGFFDSPYQEDTIGELLIIPNVPSRFRDFKDEINTNEIYFKSKVNANKNLRDILFAPEEPEDEDAIAGLNVGLIVEDNPFDLDKNPRLREIRYKGTDLVVMPITTRAAVAERARGTLSSLLSADYVGKNKLFIFPNQYPISITADQEFLMDVGNRALFGDKIANESKNDVYFPDAKVRRFEELYEKADTTPIIMYHFKLLWALADTVDHIVETTGKEPEQITDEEIEAVSRERNHFQYSQAISKYKVTVGTGKDAGLEEREITINAPGERIAIYNHKDFLNSNIASLDILNKFDLEYTKIIQNRVIVK